MIFITSERMVTQTKTVLGRGLHTRNFSRSTKLRLCLALLYIFTSSLYKGAYKTIK